MAEERRSYRGRCFGGSCHIEREEKGLECLVHRVGEGACLGGAIREEYVRRNLSQEKAEEILDATGFVELPTRRRGRTSSTASLVPKQLPSAVW